MENASKALLIAGGVLIVMVLTGFMLIVKHNVDNFYASEDELKAIADKTKFNEQFTRYNRDDVEGYELITLSNKIIDYNERLSEATTTGNDSQAEPIKIAITLWEKTDTDLQNKAKTLLSYDNELRLFNCKDNTKDHTLIVKDTNLNLKSISNLKTILNEISPIESNSKIKILTKRISSIILNTSLKGKLKYNASTKKYSFDLTEISMNDDDKEADRKNMLNALVNYESITGDKSFNIVDDTDKTKYRCSKRKLFEYAKY